MQGLLPGNQRASDGTLNNSAVWKGLAGRGASVAASLFGGPSMGALVSKGAGMLIDRGNPQGGGVPGLDRQQYTIPQAGMSVPNIGVNPSMRGNLGFGGTSYGPSAFGTAGYHYAQPQGQSTGQAPGGFANGVFNGGAGNFGPTGGTGGGMASGSMGGGGGGARGAFTFGGYANDAHKAASIAGAQDQFAAMKMGDLNKNFQTRGLSSVFGGGGIYQN